MISTLSTGVLVLFAFASVVALAVPFVTQKAGQQMSLRCEWPAVRCFAALLFPVLALFGLGQFLNIEAAQDLRYLAIAAVVPFLLARVSMPPQLRGIFLLALTVVATWLLPNTALSPTCFAIIAGLAVFKVAENLMLASESTFEDILPSMIWLSGINWIRTALPQAQFEAKEGLLLGTLAVVLLLRVVQRPLLGSDKLFVKRLVLSATGGLSVLIVIMKLIAAPDLTNIAALVGAGIFLAYLLDSMPAQADKEYGPTEAVTALVIVGILSLVASRLFGTFGLIVAAPAMLVATNAGFAHAACLFLIVRCVLQGFIYSYVANVTGVNLLHAYTSAALYGGILFAMLGGLAIREIVDRRWLSTVFLSAGVLTPLFSLYFLHEEPTGSLLIATTVAALVMAAAGPALYRQKVPGHDNILLLPVLMTAFANIGFQLIALGNEGTASDKVKVIVYCAVVILLVSLLLRWLFSRSGGKPVEVSGN